MQCVAAPINITLLFKQCKCVPLNRLVLESSAKRLLPGSIVQQGWGKYIIGCLPSSPYLCTLKLKTGPEGPVLK